MSLALSDSKDASPLNCSRKEKDGANGNANDVVSKETVSLINDGVVSKTPEISRSRSNSKAGKSLFNSGKAAVIARRNSDATTLVCSVKRFKESPMCDASRLSAGCQRMHDKILSKAV